MLLSFKERLNQIINEIRMMRHNEVLNAVGEVDSQHREIILRMREIKCRLNADVRNILYIFISVVNIHILYIYIYCSIYIYCTSSL